MSLTNQLQLTSHARRRGVVSLLSGVPTPSGGWNLVDSMFLMRSSSCCKTRCQAARPFSASWIKHASRAMFNCRERSTHSSFLRVEISSLMSMTLLLRDTNRSRATSSSSKKMQSPKSMHINPGIRFLVRIRPRRVVGLLRERRERQGQKAD